MAQGKQEEDRNDVVSSRPLTEETTKRQQLITSARTAAPLPTLPFDLLHEILCRLPVRLLVQLRCLCKSFNTLITDPKFTKKHLCLSTKQNRLVLSSSKFLLYDSPIPSVLSTCTITPTQLNFPVTCKIDHKSFRLSTCDGILCFAIDHKSAILWNPSIRKFRLLPPLKNPQKRKRFPFSLYSFGHDPFIDNYKIIGISFCINHIEVSVNTMGTNYWRRIQDFPGPSRAWDVIRRPGVFVSGTVNFLQYEVFNSTPLVIVSLDLEKESYQNLSRPELEKGKRILQLGRMRDCLCFIAGIDMFLDVWIMKEYGNKESWNKLYHVPHMVDPGFCAYTMVLDISQDSQRLMDFYELSSAILKLVVYDSENGTWHIHEIQNTNLWMNPKVYIESLISPCS
ncbi:hypothetical protein TSUD_118230 [Trifolium subterraneum]|uniref:F-box domain-containing protein n=1 Tax=Trifolium subterraneum TaxID=3900 RepID=A0A2Z6M7I5_TRISU|nr:hypothetical protein TSUD_118230 [Trifolium subterraneum]